MNAHAWFYSQPGFHDHSLRADLAGTSRPEGNVATSAPRSTVETLAIVEAWLERIAIGHWTPEQYARAVAALLRHT